MPADLLKASQYPWNMVRRAAKAGIAMDRYLLSDFEKTKKESYTLLIFANCFELSPQRITMIKNYLAKPNKTVMFMYASGLYQNGMLRPLEFEKNFGLPVQLRAEKQSEKVKICSTGKQIQILEPCNTFSVKQTAGIKALANCIRSQFFLKKVTKISGAIVYGMVHNGICRTRMS